MLKQQVILRRGTMHEVISQTNICRESKSMNGV
jgi:hypothetical protein